MEDAIEEYQSSLEDLTFNSKPHINNLTILADESKQYAEQIVKLVEAQLSKASFKLPIMYLLDSIIKNVGENYKPMFAKNIVHTFKISFESSDDKSKMALYKLRTTWDDHFPLKRLYELDVKIRTLDPNWPIKPLPTSLQDGHAATNIHVNPKFLKKGGEAQAKKPATIESRQSAPILSRQSQSSGTSKNQTPATDVDKIKQQLVQQQKELLELQQRKLMLELEQTKQQLEAKQKELHTNVSKKPTSAVPQKDPRARVIPKSNLKVTVQNNKPVSMPNSSGPKVSKDPRVKSAGLQQKPAKPDATVQPKPNGKKGGTGKDTSPPVRIAPILKKVKKPSISPNKAKATVKPSKSPQGKNLLKNKNFKKKTQNTDMPVSPVSDQDRRVKRNYRNKTRSPSPPPPKMARNHSPVPSPSRSISPDSNVVRNARRKEKPNRRERELFHNDVPGSSDGSLSPAFSPEPDTDEAQMNASSSDTRIPAKRNRPHEAIQRRKSVDPNVEIPQELTLSHQNEILRQADVQLRNGQLTHEQHQELLKQLHQLFELQRVRKAQGAPALSPMVNKRQHRQMRRSPSPTDPRLRRQPQLQERMHNEMPPHFSNRGPRFDMPMESELRPHHKAERNFYGSFRNDGRPPMKRIPRRPFNKNDDKIPPDKRRRRSPPRGGRTLLRDPRPPMPHNSKFPQMHDRIENINQNQRRSLSPPQAMHLSPPRFMKKQADNSRHKGRSLRRYAHPDEKMEKQHEFVKDNLQIPDEGAGNLSDADSLNKHGPEEPEDYIIANMPKIEEKQGPEEPEDYIIANIPEKEKTPPCEEPEDYIIANMPPGAEAYHKHSMGLKKKSESEKAYLDHMKKLKKSMYMKELNAKKREQSLTSEGSATEESTSEIAQGSDTDQGTSKKSEEALKSPPLPLKKRRYVSVDSERESKMDTSEVSDSSAVETEKAKPEGNKEDKVGPESETHIDEPKEMPANQVVTPEDHAKETDNRPNATSISQAENSDNMQTEPTPDNIDSEKNDKRNISPIVEPTNDHDKPESPKMLDDIRQKLDENPLVYVIDDEEEGGPPTEPFRGRFDHHGRRDRPLLPRPGHHRPREFNNEEDRIQRMLEDEKKNLEWENSLHHQLEMEERISQERRRGMFPRYQRGRGRGGPPPPRRERWDSPDHEMNGPPPFDISHGKIPGRNPPRSRMPPDSHHRPPLLRDPRRREPRFPHFRAISPPPPPPDFMSDPRRPMSPPGRRMPLPRRPVDMHDDRMPGWDRPREDRYPPHDMPRPVGEDRRPPPISEPPFEPPAQPPAVMKQVNVNKLLSDLLNMGILPGASKKPEAKSNSPVPSKSVDVPQTSQAMPSPQMQTQNLITEPAVIDKMPVVEQVSKPELREERNRSVSPLDEEMLNIDPDANLPEVTFTSNLKTRHDEIVKRLYTGIQCSACGLRFTTRQTDIYAEHLDWHYRINRKDKEGGAQVHREIYPSAGDWICHEEVEDPVERDKNTFFEGEEAENEQEELTVPLTGKPGEDCCKVCKEAFETVYNEAEDEWQFTNCVKVGEDNFHPSCYEDYYDGPPVQTPMKAATLFQPASESEDIPGVEVKKQISVENSDLETTEPEPQQNLVTVKMKPTNPPIMDIVSEDVAIDVAELTQDEVPNSEDHADTQNHSDNQNEQHSQIDNQDETSNTEVPVSVGETPVLDSNQLSNTAYNVTNDEPTVQTDKTPTDVVNVSNLLTSVVDDVIAPVTSICSDVTSPVASKDNVDPDSETSMNDDDISNPATSLNSDVTKTADQ
uniref:Pre-mRNA cleavage complex 2 protein Pcf11 n=1 Tax=Phallusia mammillata TaxID=59560 RepID=A0A6F9DNI4_9ASCI|nr:pre-mRNA cleavage complex 2 protein Pcf11 [Phallusia mammillata]